MKDTVIITGSSNVVRGSFRRGLVSRLIEQIKAWNERKIAERQLNVMSDRLLRDIGINRIDIPKVVNQKGEFRKVVFGRTDSADHSVEIRRAA